MSSEQETTTMTDTSADTPDTPATDNTVTLPEPKEMGSGHLLNEYTYLSERVGEAFAPLPSGHAGIWAAPAWLEEALRRRTLLHTELHRRLAAPAPAPATGEAERDADFHIVTRIMAMATLYAIAAKDGLPDAMDRYDELSRAVEALSRPADRVVAGITAEQRAALDHLIVRVHNDIEYSPDDDDAISILTPLLADALPPEED